MAQRWFCKTAFSRGRGPCARPVAPIAAALVTAPAAVTRAMPLPRRTVVRAVAAVGRTGEVNVATFDLSASFLESVSKGDAAFAIDQQQFLQGYLPVSFLALNANYGLIPGGNVPSGPNLITQDKAAQVVELSAEGIR